MVRFDPGQKHMPQTWIVLAGNAEARIFARQYVLRQLPRGRRQYIDDTQYDLMEVTDNIMRAGDAHDLANMLALYLNNAGREGRFERLVLVAPADMLDTLHQKLTAVIRERVIAELPQPPGGDQTALLSRLGVQRG